MQLFSAYSKKQITPYRLKELKKEFLELSAISTKTKKQWLRLARLKKWLEDNRDLWPEEADTTRDRKRKATLNKPDGIKESEPRTPQDRKV